jgi:hypothetical protein
LIGGVGQAGSGDEVDDGCVHFGAILRVGITHACIRNEQHTRFGVGIDLNFSAWGMVGAVGRSGNIYGVVIYVVAILKIIRSSGTITQGVVRSCM